MVISGNATTADGQAVDFVRVFLWPDQQLVGAVSPDSSGDWSFNVVKSGNYGVTYMAEGCQPVTHGPYYIEVEWSPLALTPLLWLNGSDEDSLVVDEANRIQQWIDSSGNDNHAAQQIESSRPAQTTLNGFVAPDFGDSYLICPHLSSPGNITILFVAVGTGGSNVSLAGSSNDSYLPIATISGGSSTDILRINGQRNPAGSAILVNGEQTPSLLSRGAVHSGLVTGAAELCVFNNLPNEVGALEIGRGGASVNWYWYGPIAEVLVIPAETSVSDRQMLEGYLAHKWGIESKLPAGHPYRIAAP